jgi:hypothetical protein
MNPSGQPFPNQYGGAPPPPGGGGPAEALNVPGILFIVFGAFGVLSALLGVVRGADMTAFNQALSDPNLPPEAKDIMRMLGGYLSGPAPKVMNLISAIMSGLMVFGGVQMRQLKNYGLAIATCIIGIMPICGGCCCCITMPLGIWTLTILMRPEIKSAFT